MTAMLPVEHTQPFPITWPVRTAANPRSKCGVTRTIATCHACGANLRACAAGRVRAGMQNSRDWRPHTTSAPKYETTLTQRTRRMGHVERAADRWRGRCADLAGAHVDLDRGRAGLLPAALSAGDARQDAKAANVRSGVVAALVDRVRVDRDRVWRVADHDRAIGLVSSRSV